MGNPGFKKLLDEVRNGAELSRTKIVKNGKFKTVMQCGSWDVTHEWMFDKLVEARKAQARFAPEEERAA